jgi:hypothetical protein
MSPEPFLTREASRPDGQRLRRAPGNRPPGSEGRARVLPYSVPSTGNARAARHNWTGVAVFVGGLVLMLASAVAYAVTH